MQDTRAGWPHLPRQRERRDVLAGLEHRPPRLQLIVGEAGAGKTALASEVAASIPGRRVVTVTALAERAATPLAAFHDVLRDLAVSDDAEAAATELIARLGSTADRQVLLVDDLPRLDRASGEVVHRLVTGFGMPTVATARSGEPATSVLDRLDDEGLVDRHELAGLTRDEVAELLVTRFRVPVRDDDLTRLVWQTGGNPLHLRILVESAIEAGEVLHRGDRVEFTGVHEPSVLRDVVHARLATLDAESRRLLAVVSLAQPVPRAALLTARGREEVLADLAERGLLAADGARARWRVAHPLVSESIEAYEEFDDARAEAIRLLRAGGEPSRRYAAVELQLAAGSPVAQTELVWAAGYASASGDHRAAAALADAAVALPARRSAAFAAHLTAAVAHSLARDLDRADRLFDAAGALVETPPERAALASGLGDHLAARLEDPAAAIAQAEAVRALLTPAESVALDADLWRWRVLAGHGTGDADREHRLRVAITATVAAAMRGEPAAARAASEALAVPAAVLGPLSPAAAIALGLQRTVELRAGGDPEAAAAYLESARAEAGDEVGFFTVMLAAQRLHEGRLADARAAAELAVEQHRRWDGGELIAFALAVRATAAAQQGDVDDARRDLDELEVLAARDPLAVSGAAVLQRAECEAYLLAASGSPAAAADLVLEVVAAAIGSGYRFLGALTLGAALRFGEVARTADLAESLCAGMAEHAEPCVAVRDLARALRDGALDRVGGAARRVVATGLAPVAVDGLALAARMPGPDSQRRRLQAFATAVGSEFDAPLLQSAELPALSPRELEVARAAAGRMRSREIAEQLDISVRTVENQLYSVYRKLAVGSRDELRDALVGLGLLSDALLATSTEPE